MHSREIATLQRERRRDHCPLSLHYFSMDPNQETEDNLDGCFSLHSHYYCLSKTNFIDLDLDEDFVLDSIDDEDNIDGNRPDLAYGAKKGWYLFREFLY